MVLHDARLVIFGANDLSDEADVSSTTVVPKQRKSKTAAFISDFRDLTVGDYVVHVDHGIARYLGLKEISQDGMHVEFMILEFADSARLYVPLTRLDLIQKYRSTDSGPAPVLHRWERAMDSYQGARQKSHGGHGGRAAEAVRGRKAAQGNAFTPDTQLHEVLQLILRVRLTEEVRAFSQQRFHFLSHIVAGRVQHTQSRPKRDRLERKIAPAVDQSF